jgi:release factor glutamine methyltransferase
MKNSKLLFQDFVKQIRLPESQDELSSIAHMVFEHVFGISRTEVLAAKPIQVTAANDAILVQILQRLNQHEPLQYILGEADFFGRKFMVNAAVLIPRPETEELVNYILQESTGGNAKRILDIGTGSGCIPITLALEIKGSEV